MSDDTKEFDAFGYKLRGRDLQVERDKVDLSHPGDYGADPLGPDDNGVFMFRLVPSGRVVSQAEKDEILARYRRA